MSVARPLDKTEYERFKESFKGVWGPRNRAVFVLGVKTGFRISEILSLKVGDVVDQNRTIAGEIEVKRQNMKKKQESRSVPVHPELLEELEKYADWLESKNLLLRSRPLFPANGNRFLTRQEYWAVMKRAAMLVGVHGRGISTHTMRKTFAERVHVHFMEAVLKGEKVDVLRSTQETLGHKDPESTTHYLRENKKRVWEAVMAI